MGRVGSILANGDWKLGRNLVDSKCLAVLRPHVTYLGGLVPHRDPSPGAGVYLGRDMPGTVRKQIDGQRSDGFGTASFDLKRHVLRRENAALRVSETMPPLAAE